MVISYDLPSKEHVSEIAERDQSWLRLYYGQWRHTDVVAASESSAKRQKQSCFA
jgi:hypothetical protein